MTGALRGVVLAVSLALTGLAVSARAEDWASVLAQVDPAIAVELEFLLRGGPDLEEWIEVYRRATWVSDVALDELAVAEDAHFASLGTADDATVAALAAEVVTAQESYGAALAEERAALLQLTGGMMLSGEAELALRDILLP